MFIQIQTISVKLCSHLETFSLVWFLNTAKRAAIMGPRRQCGRARTYLRPPCVPAGFSPASIRSGRSDKARPGACHSVQAWRSFRPCTARSGPFRSSRRKSRTDISDPNRWSCDCDKRAPDRSRRRRLACTSKPPKSITNPAST